VSMSPGLSLSRRGRIVAFRVRVIDVQDHIGCRRLTVVPVDHAAHLQRLAGLALPGNGGLPNELPRHPFIHQLAGVTRAPPPPRGTLTILDTGRPSPPPGAHGAPCER